MIEEQGASHGRYAVIPRTLVFLFSGNQVLLLQGSASKKIWAGKFNGLGGHIEPGEHIQAAALRELKEEAGLQHIQLTHCGTIMVDTQGNPGVCIFIFKGQYNAELLTQSSEGELHLIPMESIHEYPLVADLYDLLPRVHKWLPGSRLIIGRYFYTENKMLTEFED